MLTDILYKLKCLILSILDKFLQIKFSLKISLTAKFGRHNNSYLSVVIYSHMQHLYHYEFRIVNVRLVLENADWVLLVNCTYMPGFVDLNEKMLVSMQCQNNVEKFITQKLNLKKD